jgi:hypothetical protein
MANFTQALKAAEANPNKPASQEFMKRLQSGAFDSYAKASNVDISEYKTGKTGMKGVDFYKVGVQNAAQNGKTIKPGDGGILDILSGGAKIFAGNVGAVFGSENAVELGKRGTEQARRGIAGTSPTMGAVMPETFGGPGSAIESETSQLAGMKSIQKEKGIFSTESAAAMSEYWGPKALGAAMAPEVPGVAKSALKSVEAIPGKIKNVGGTIKEQFAKPLELKEFRPEGAPTIQDLLSESKLRTEKIKEIAKGKVPIPPAKGTVEQRKALSALYESESEKIATKYGERKFPEIMNKSKMQSVDLLKNKYGINEVNGELYFKNTAITSKPEQNILQGMYDELKLPTASAGRLNTIRQRLKQFNESAQVKKGPVSSTAQAIYDLFRSNVGNTIPEWGSLNKTYAAAKTGFRVQSETAKIAQNTYKEALRDANPKLKRLITGQREMIDKALAGDRTSFQNFVDFLVKHKFKISSGIAIEELLRR